MLNYLRINGLEYKIRTTFIPYTWEIFYREEWGDTWLYVGNFELRDKQIISFNGRNDRRDKINERDLIDYLNNLRPLAL